MKASEAAAVSLPAAKPLPAKKPPPGRRSWKRVLKLGKHCDQKAMHEHPLQRSTTARISDTGGHKQDACTLHYVIPRSFLRRSIAALIPRQSQAKRQERVEVRSLARTADKGLANNPLISEVLNISQVQRRAPSSLPFRIGGRGWWQPTSWEAGSLGHNMATTFEEFWPEIAGVCF